MSDHTTQRSAPVRVPASARYALDGKPHKHKHQLPATPRDRGKSKLRTMRNCGRLLSPSRRGAIGSASGIGNGERSHAAVCRIGRVAERDRGVRVRTLAKSDQTTSRLVPVMVQRSQPGEFATAPRRARRSSARCRACANSFGRPGAGACRVPSGDIGPHFRATLDRQFSHHHRSSPQRRDERRRHRPGRYRAVTPGPTLTRSIRFFEKCQRLRLARNSPPLSAYEEIEQSHSASTTSLRLFTADNGMARRVALARGPADAFDDLFGR